MSYAAPSAAADPDELLQRALNHFAPQPAPRSAWTFRLAVLGFALGAAAFVMEAISLSRGVGWGGTEAPRTIDSMAPIPEKYAFAPPPPSPPPVAEGSSSRPPPAMPPAPSPAAGNGTSDGTAELPAKRLTMLEAADATANQQQSNASVAAPAQATFQVLWGESSAASAGQGMSGKQVGGGSSSGSADGSAGDGGGAGGGGGGGPTAMAAPRGERPNLLLMVADDLAAGELGEYRKVQGQGAHGLTPNIDSLAHKGTLFMQVRFAHRAPHHTARAHAGTALARSPASPSRLPPAHLVLSGGCSSTASTYARASPTFAPSRPSLHHPHPSQAHSVAPLCTPSRFALLTGVQPACGALQAGSDAPPPGATGAAPPPLVSYDSILRSEDSHRALPHKLGALGCGERRSEAWPCAVPRCWRRRRRCLCLPGCLLRSIE